MGEGRLTPSLDGRASAAVFPHCRLDDVPGVSGLQGRGDALSCRVDLLANDDHYRSPGTALPGLSRREEMHILTVVVGPRQEPKAELVGTRQGASGASRAKF